MLIFNARALIGDHFQENTILRIENGRIAALGRDLTPNPGESTFDAEGNMLVPGFIDVHIHGYGGCDTMNGKAHIQKMAEGLVQHGVTAFLPTTMAAPYEDTRNALIAASELMDAAPVGARVLGCHLEGPFLNVAKKGAQPAQFIFPPSMENYLRIAQGHERAVKLMTIAPEVPGSLELIRALRNKTRLSAGHTVATIDQMEESAKAGITMVTHLFNGMNALEHRAPGVPGGSLTIDAIRVQLIADLLHLHSAALKLAWRAKGADGCVLITDSMEATGMPDGEYMLGANHVFVKDRAALLADGTLAGSTLTLDRAIKNMVQTVGVPIEQAIHMASTSPAAAIGETERGQIAPGFHADLVWMSEDCKILATMVGGEFAYQA